MQAKTNRVNDPAKQGYSKNQYDENIISDSESTVKPFSGKISNLFTECSFTTDPEHDEKERARVLEEMAAVREEFKTIKQEQIHKMYDLWAHKIFNKSIDDCSNFEYQTIETLVNDDSDKSKFTEEAEEEVEAEKQKEKASLKFDWQFEYEIESKPANWDIENYIEHGSFVEIYGESESFKSFIGIDMACCVATGNQWHNKKTKQGLVLLLAGEGRNGIKKRIKAWKKANMKNENEAIPLAVSSVPGSMLDTRFLAEMSKATTLLARDHGFPSIIVIDTLARNFGPGDENSTKDMSAFVSACDLLRSNYGCTIIVIHHTGLADKTRARGNYALKAGLDSEFFVTRDEDKTIRFECSKMKDFERPDPLAFKPRVIDLDYKEENGEPATSCVLDEIEYTEKKAHKVGKAGEGKNQKLLIGVLDSAPDGIDEALLRIRFKENGGDRRRFTETIDSLINQGIVYRENGRILRL